MKNRLEKALRFEEEYKSRIHTKYMQFLGPYISMMPILFHDKENETSSRMLLLGLTMSMEGIIKDRNKLGIFSSDYEKVANLLASGLIQLRKDGHDEMQMRLLSKLIMGSLTTLLGLLWVAYDEVIRKAEEVEGETIDSKFFIELLLNTVYTSSLPKATFKSMAQATGADDKESETAALAVETLTLLFALVAFSMEGSLNDDLLESHKERLLQNFGAMEETLNDLVLLKRIDKLQAQPVRLFIGQGKQTLNSGNFSQFLKGLIEMCKPYGISIDKLKTDIQASRRLFASLGSHVAKPKQPRENSISLMG